MHIGFVKELTRQDMEDVVALLDQVALKETTNGYYEPLSSDLRRELMESINDGLKKGVCHVLIARNEAYRIIGMITLEQQQLPAQKHIIAVKRCVIDDTYRGSMLLSQGLINVLDKAKDLGCEQMILDVRSDGPVELWRRLGFQEYGRLEDYARIRGDVYCGVYMSASVRDLRALAGLSTDYPVPSLAM
jgi:L-amino acid N-acyltransferase YncA